MNISEQGEHVEMISCELEENEKIFRRELEENGEMMSS